ncbi:sigma-70 family RNA polymerase sigma factor [Kitasatospora sp. NA04385]|uniref:sigma factor-like helix-turn-helix DNA-binding protein n=1 Tax=Kitasatospora sp. NA04385 TaxID=2742135 RepID=UPI00159018BA|nr:sigma factor-like helix-turn-helix DNA-binding protein [Kitasatospora sp. NA04385]QKW20661.1 sigma-70 family RNA polymerase sigma factor [Kitasatospora sp. NA04385]
MNESDWAVGDRSRLTFDAFCESRTKAWAGFARAQLRDEEAAAKALSAVRKRVWQEWPRILREQIPAFHAWTILKEEIGAALAEMLLTGRPLPTRESVPSWVYAVKSAAERAQDLMTEGSHQQLYAALRRLPERRRDVIVLRYLLDLPDAQIADYLGTGEVNVRSTASQALDRLAVALGGTRGERQ